MYTEKETEKLVKEYEKGKTPKELGVLLNKTERSIIGKLVSLEVYKKKQREPNRLENIKEIENILGVKFDLHKNYINLFRRDNLTLLVEAVEKLKRSH